jgi:hypothetical protein
MDRRPVPETAMRTASALLALLVAGTAAAGPPREPMDEAVDRGLLFLRSQQLPDGGWPSAGGLGGGFGGRHQPAAGNGDPAVTALAVMAFLSAGHVPGEGRHGAAVERGVRFVMNAQSRQGMFTSASANMYDMYYHGICTLMLAEAAGMTPGGRAADELRQRLEAAVAVILAAQRRGATADAGGWRYHLNGFDSDLSVTGWQLMALRGAKNVGCDVPAERIQAAVGYIRRCHDATTGGYRYTVPSHVTVPCTGTGILALELCGKEYHRSPEALRAGAYILRNPLRSDQQHFFYGVYYVSQAMFQLGGNEWKSYRPLLHGLLLRTNPPDAGGAWYGRGGFDDVRFGPCYCTSMAVLALTVEYRYLPIYQRFEEPVETIDD